MKPSTKVLLGLASLWPFVYMIFFFIFVLSSFFFLSSSPGQEFGPPVSFMVVFLLHLLTILWIMALTVFYIVNVFRNERVDKDKKVLWAVVLFMGNIIAMPIYWYLYIWKDQPAEGLSSPAELASGDKSGWVNEVRASSRDQEYVPPAQPPDWR